MRRARRDPLVGHLANEQVAERVLRLALDGGDALAPHELLALQRAKALVRPRGGAAEVLDGAEPERAAEDGRVLQSRFSSAGSVSSRAAMMPWTVCGTGSRRRRRDSALGEHPHELLGVQRVAPCAREELRHQVAGQHGLLEQRRRAGSTSRRRRAAPARSSWRWACRRPSPAGARAAPGGPCRRPASDAGRPLDEVVDEVEQALVGPVEILEHEHERPLSARASRKRRQAANSSPRSRPASSAAATDRAAFGGGPRPSRPRPRRRCVRDRRASFSWASSAVGLEDPCLGLHHLRERPESDAFAVRQARAASPGDELGVVLDRPTTARRRAASCRCPARPTIVTSWGERSLRALRKRRRATRSLARRPTSGARASFPRIGADTGARPRPPARRAPAPSCPWRVTGWCLVLDRARGLALRRLADEYAVHRRGCLQAGGVLTKSPDDPLAPVHRARRARPAPRPC